MVSPSYSVSKKSAERFNVRPDGTQYFSNVFERADLNRGNRHLLFLAHAQLCITLYVEICEKPVSGQVAASAETQYR